MSEVTFDPKKPMDWVQGCLGLILIGAALVFVAGLLAPDSEPETQAAPPKSPPAVVQEESPEPEPEPIPELPIGEQVSVSMLYGSPHVQVDNQTGETLTGVQMRIYPTLEGPRAGGLFEVEGPSSPWRANELGTFPPGITLVRHSKFLKRGEEFDRFVDPHLSITLKCDQGWGFWGFQD